EVAPRKGVSSLLVLGSEDRQAVGSRANDGTDRRFQVEEEAGQIGVPFVEVQPDRSWPRSTQVAPEQAGLPRTRWSGQPGHGSIRGLVEQLDQSGPLAHVVELRRYDLRGCHDGASGSNPLA